MEGGREKEKDRKRKIRESDFDETSEQLMRGKRRKMLGEAGKTNDCEW